MTVSFPWIKQLFIISTTTQKKLYIEERILYRIRGLHCFTARQEKTIIKLWHNQ
jgi:hypothetical protein